MKSGQTLRAPSRADLHRRQAVKLALGAVIAIWLYWAFTQTLVWALALPGARLW